MPVINDVLKTNNKHITMPVVVLLQRVGVKNNPWVQSKWQAAGVLPMTKNTNSSNSVILISNINNEPIYQYNEFELTLSGDELDSYYQNISSNNACIFIICRENNDNNPEPFLVTLSYDEAAIYMETDEIVYSVAIDIKLYQIIEKFVLERYRPEKRKKRKLTKGSAGEHYKTGSVYE